MKDLKNYIKQVLINESLAGVSKLKKYVKEPPQYYVYMSSINKIGINPKFSYGNPIGIYSYILDEETFYDITIGNQEFATDRPYMFVIRPREGANILYTSEDMTFEEMKEYEKKILKFLDNKKYSLDDIISLGVQSRYKFNLGKLWNVMRSVTKDVIQWRKLLKYLEIDAIIDDDGTGMLHPSEQKQAWFSDVNSFEIVDVIYSEGGTKMDTYNMPSETLLALLSKKYKGKMEHIDPMYFKFLEDKVEASINIGNITPKDLKKYGLKRLYDEIHRVKVLFLITPNEDAFIFNDVKSYFLEPQNLNFPEGKYKTVKISVPPEAIWKMKTQWKEYLAFQEYYEFIDNEFKKKIKYMTEKDINRYLDLFFKELKGKIPNKEIQYLKTMKHQLFNFIKNKSPKSETEIIRLAQNWFSGHPRYSREIQSVLIKLYDFQPQTA